MTTRWGLLGAGWISRAFATDLRLLDDHEVLAIGSRSQQTADDFGEQVGVPRRYATYDALVADPDVDVVYVGTPHPMHHAAAMLALEAGKPVLVEKPFTLNAPEAVELVDTARGRGLLLQEAMWTRFLPHMVQVRQHLADGDLGDVRVVLADHNQQFPPDPTHRLFAPELGGGALLDLGIYPMSFASMVLGEPRSVTAVATKAFTGVDAQTAVVLGYDDGRQAVVFTTLEVKGPNRAAIVGTKARIEIDEVWYTPTTFRLIAADGTVLRAYDEPHEGHGLRHQAAEVARCLREGLVESPLLTHEETVSIMRTLDEVRVQVGVTYPTEISPGVPRP